jgi:hypothetical protein
MAAVLADAQAAPLPDNRGGLDMRVMWEGDFSTGLEAGHVLTNIRR